MCMNVTKTFFLFSQMKFGSNQSKPEFTVDLRGATIEMASKDKSSKKNVFEVIFFLSVVHILNHSDCMFYIELFWEIVF